MNEEEMRAEVARQAGLLTTEDQARVLKVIYALQLGLHIELNATPKLSAADLREWADQIGEKKS